MFILKDNNHEINKQEILDFMRKFKLKSQFSENTTKVGFQLNHILAHVPRNECKFGVIEAYGLDFHKLIYILYSNYQTHFLCITKNHCRLHFFKV
jgi:hypothetical protein